MAGPIEVTDPADPRLADYAGLTDSALRMSLEAEHGLFIAEGEKVIARARAAGLRIRSLLVTAGKLPRLGPLAEDCGAPVYLLAEPAARQLTGYRVHRGALAAVDRPPLPPVPRLLAAARRVLVLEDLVDHGNVGAIFRCAAAFGLDAVIVSPRCADPLYRRAVKVSMGAVFAVPWSRMDDWYGGLGAVRAAGFRLLALTPDQAAVPVAAAFPAPAGSAPAGSAPAGSAPAGSAPAGSAPAGSAPAGSAPAAAERVALLLGTEGDGLSSRWRHEADQAVCIPMDPAAMARGLDSLNVVAAAAVACYVLATPPGDRDHDLGVAPTTPKS